MLHAMQDRLADTAWEWLRELNDPLTVLVFSHAFQAIPMTQPYHEHRCASGLSVIR